MNRRIRELAEQAGFEITLWSNESVPCVHQEGPIDVELEKFAELIVKKCLEQIDKIRDGCEDDSEYQQALGAAWAGLAVARYFGVEE